MESVYSMLARRTLHYDELRNSRLHQVDTLIQPRLDVCC